MNKGLNRRDFLKVAGLTIAVVVTPGGYRLVSAMSNMAGADNFSPNAWLRVSPDNLVTVFVNKSEMGQGVHTALPMIIADELGADWGHLQVQMAPAGDAYRDPVWGSQTTGGSTSVRHMYLPLRKAGAAAREMLIEAAARAWKVPAAECDAQGGEVRHAKSGKSASFGSLADQAAKLPVPQDPALKKDSDLIYIGTSKRRIDTASKVSGTAQFGIDTQITGMLQAAVARPPAFGARLLSFDEKAARSIAGVRGVVVTGSGVAVCAETLHGAWRGREALSVKWDRGEAPGLSKEVLHATFLGGLEEMPAIIARDDGDAAAAIRASGKTVNSVYALPYLAHATMEPMNCTASVTKDRCEIWAPTQNQTGTLMTAAKVTGIPKDRIVVHTTYLGGGFGRRFEVDVVEEAVTLSKAMGIPVKVTWTREEDMRHDFFRPANCCRIAGAIDGEGRISAWSHKIVCPSIFGRVFPDMVKNGVDPAAVEGIENMEYEIPNVRVEYVRMDTPVPVGFWRSVGSSHNAFTVESFMDELAHAAAKDPLEFRLSHLSNHRRAARVLEAAADKAGWGKQVAPGTARGIAQHYCFGSYVAHVAEVSIDKKERSVRVHRVVCAVDCGSVINPDTVRAQMMSGIIMGLSGTLKEQVDFSRGGVSTSNFDDYPVLRMSESPEIEVHVVASGDELGGIGEPGLPPVAPAVANGVFALTGVRVRELPLIPAVLGKAGVE